MAKLIKGKNDLQTVNPELAKEWHPSKNENISPSDVQPGSCKKVWWKCSKGHEWEAAISNRTNGKGCPFCSGRYAIAGVNDLLTLYPEIAQQWNYGKNGELSPTDVKAQSNKKVWWICEKGHEWQATVADRTNGKGCPFCTGRYALSGINDLSTMYPEIAQQWNYKKNGELSPKDVKSHSAKTVWWTCSNGHEWQAKISDRVNGNGCPYCSGHYVIKGENDLLTLYPELAKEWDFDKNGDVTPKDVKPHSNKKAWWICEKGHRWQAKISDRVKGSGCPYCNAELKTSFPEQSLFFYLSKVYKAESRYIIDKNEIDIYLIEFKIGIEYDGMYYHNSVESERRENKKNQALKDKGIRLIRIKETRTDNMVVGDTIYYVPDHSHSRLNETIIRLFELIDSILGTHNSKQIIIDIEKDKIEILNNYKQTIKENSLAVKYPSIANEWNYQKNGTLSPEMFSFGSTQKVWWKCSNGHEWQASVVNRIKGTGCPYCSGNKVLVGFNDLATVNPEIASQWHPTKNEPLMPQEFMVKSNKKVWWLCKNGHSYEMTISNKTSGMGCPFCYGRYAIKGENDLATLVPDLAKQWDYAKNGDLTPYDVKPTSNIKVWWICSNGHEWQARINSRMDGNSCPYCSGRLAIKGVNDLLTVNPELAKQWNYNKNGALTPRDVKPHSNKKVWWICEEGHEWQATVNDRTNGTGCPECQKNIAISRNAKPVLQLSLDETVIAEFKSTKEAERQTGIKSIRKVCKGKGKTAGGYKWRYKFDE